MQTQTQTQTQATAQTSYTVIDTTAASSVNANSTFTQWNNPMSTQSSNQNEEAKSKTKGSNTMQNKSTNLNKVSTVIDEADQLSKQYEVFLVRSNKELYGILGSVYSLYVNAEKEKCLDDTVTAMKVVLKERDVKVQNNTPKMTVFVRYVFNIDRKIAYKYARTLLAALDSDISPNSFVDFVENNKGVEQIKRKYTKTEEQLQQDEALNKAIPLTKERLSTMESVQTVKFSNPSVTQSDDTEFVFVIARVTASGELELLRTVPKTTVGMEATAIKLIAQQDLELKSEKVVEQKTEEVNSLVQQAADSATKREPEMA